MKKEKNNVVDYHSRPINVNIGLIIFVIIFIYLLFNVFSYMTETHVSVYEVQQGTIAVNNVYEGLVLRNEQIYTTDHSGSINYYVKEKTKIGYNDLVCSIDESGTVSDMISEAGTNVSDLDKESLVSIEDRIYQFQDSYNATEFYSTYNFKSDINAALNEALSMTALNSISDYVTTAENNQTFHKQYAAEDGIVAYYTDGFEQVTKDTFTADMLDSSTYSKVDLKKNTDVVAGSPIYKVITNENWDIVVPISNETALDLSEESVLKIRFLNDNKEIYANSSVITREGQYFLILSLKSNMVRYAGERYIRIELLYSEESGLKIPISSITEKEFYTIPLGYFLKGGDSTKDGLLVKHFNEGEVTTEFVSPTIYYETEEFYYIDSEDVSAGDIIIKPDSSEEYVIGTNTDSLKGVYNINKGYAVFKQIDPLYQNEEYCIIKTGTTYGISLYDHIALDASKVQENELIK